jgi:hypothetical protein
LTKRCGLIEISRPKHLKTLASRIERQMHGAWKHCAIYENDLERIWPLNEKDRETKIAQFAKKYGFRLRFYKKGNVRDLRQMAAARWQMMRPICDRRTADTFNKSARVKINAALIQSPKRFHSIGCGMPSRSSQQPS